MNTDFNEAITLHNEGYTPEEIAESTGKSRATIYRWLEQHKASLQLAGIPEVDDFEEEDFEEDDESPKAIPGLSGLEKANELKERELETLGRKAKVESEKIKRSTLKEFKRVISTIKEYARGFKWKHSDVVETRDEIENLEEKVHEALEFDENAIEINSISQILNILKGEFSQLADSGADFSFTFNFSDHKMEFLDNALSIESFDNNEFDMEDYHRQATWQTFIDLIDKFREFSGTSIGSEEVEECKASINEFKDMVDELSADLKEEFDSEMEVLDAVTEYLKELAIRIDESLFHSKRFLLPEEVGDRINDLIDNESETENASKNGE